jgi:hypothetical protein
MPRGRKIVTPGHEKVTPGPKKVTPRAQKGAPGAQKGAPGGAGLIPSVTAGLQLIFLFWVVHAIRNLNSL